MNREAIQELYALDDHVWQQVVEIISSASRDALTTDAPGSGWPNLRNCLAHIIFGYDRWLAIMTSEPPTDVAESLQTLSEIAAARSSFRTGVNSLLQSLGDEALQDVRPFTIDDDKMPYSYAELLAHLALHERGHHGDITTLFWQLGIEPDTAFEYRFHLGREPL